MPTRHEELTSQIDGATDTFNTAFHRNLGQATVFYNSDKLSSLSWSEPNDQQIQLVFVPTNPDELHIVYETDETIQGRVQAFPFDPSGIGSTLPNTLLDFLADLEQKNVEQDGRLDVLEAGSALKEKIVQPIIVANDGDNVFTLLETPVDTADVQVTLQGVEHKQGVDFTVVGNTLTWLDVQTLNKDECLLVSYFFIP